MTLAKNGRRFQIRAVWKRARRNLPLNEPQVGPLRCLDFVNRDSHDPPFVVSWRAMPPQPRTETKVGFKPDKLAQLLLQLPGAIPRSRQTRA
jgi:hypothetical protein